jgi:hypothetical protein
MDQGIAQGHLGSQRRVLAAMVIAVFTTLLNWWLEDSGSDRADMDMADLVQQQQQLLSPGEQMAVPSLVLLTQLPPGSWGLGSPRGRRAPQGGTASYSDPVHACPYDINRTARTARFLYHPRARSACLDQPDAVASVGKLLSVWPARTRSEPRPEGPQHPESEAEASTAFQQAIGPSGRQRRSCSGELGWAHRCLKNCRPRGDVAGIMVPVWPS